ncbi:hypothetical protein DMN77_08230 [Paenibacillus sp. 79R4]|nr:hypothetical protein [Paenibacillus sp. 79R4]
MHQGMRVRVSEESADILLAKEMNIGTSLDGKYFLFPNAVVRDEYDRRRRERKREESRLHQGVHGDSQTANRYKERIKHSTSYNFRSVPRRPSR